MTPLERLLEQASTATLLIEEMGTQLPRIYRDLQGSLVDQHARVFHEFPDLLKGGRCVVEVGPGNGCFLALLRECGNIVLGIEQEKPAPVLASNVARATKQQIAAYAKLTVFWGLDVRQWGFNHYIQRAPDPFPLPAGSVDLFYFSRSLDGVLLHFQEDVSGAIQRLLQVCGTALRPGGQIWIQHNSEPPLEKALSAFQVHTQPPLYLNQRYIMVKGNPTEAITQVVKV